MIAKRLVSENPASTDAKRDFSVILNKLGDVLVKAGKLPEGTTCYKASHKIRDRLARENPASAQAQRDLSLSLNNLGKVLLQWHKIDFEFVNEEDGTLAEVSERKLDPLVMGGYEIGDVLGNSVSLLEMVRPPMRDCVG